MASMLLLLLALSLFGTGCARSRRYSNANSEPDAAGALNYPADSGPLGPFVAATQATLRDWK